MSGDTSILPSREDAIFPLTNRSAPILERLRERRSNGSLVNQAAERIATVALMDDEDQKEEMAKQTREEFIASLSDHLGVDEEQINVQVADEFAALFGSLDESDLVTEPLHEKVDEMEDVEDDGADSESDDEDGDVQFT